MPNEQILNYSNILKLFHTYINYFLRFTIHKLIKRIEKQKIFQDRKKCYTDCVKNCAQLSLV